MKEIALILVCYNKKDDAITCIQSVLESTIGNYDLIVVDNCSTDGSAECISEIFGDKIIMIVNETNKGAGGGFNTGLRYALEHDYKYAMTLDHDVILDRNAIEILYQFISQHADVAVVGSKFCYLSQPDIIQWTGGCFNKSAYKFQPLNANTKDDGTLPEIIYCDCLASGAAMFNCSILKKTGIFKESYFIYHEDTELSMRFKKFGYKVAICTKSRVLHQFGISQYSQKNTFATYYTKRNLLNIFATYLEESEIDLFCRFYLKDIFQSIYSCHYQKKQNALKTIMFAFDDGINKCFGIAKEDKILPVDIIEDRYINLVENAENILIVDSGQFFDRNKCIINLVNKINKIKPSDITIETMDVEISHLLNNNDIKLSPSVDAGQFDLKFYICEHIFSVPQFLDNYAYVDPFLNVVITNEDKSYCLGFDKGLELFHSYMFPLLSHKIRNYTE